MAFELAVVYRVVAARPNKVSPAVVPRRRGSGGRWVAAALLAVAEEMAGAEAAPGGAVGRGIVHGCASI
jgi:hypothetical protein